MDLNNDQQVGACLTGDKGGYRYSVKFVVWLEFGCMRCPLLARIQSLKASFLLL